MERKWTTQTLFLRERLARGRGWEAHKILKTVFLLISRQMHYRDSVTDFEALSVARNGPRWMKMLKTPASSPPPPAVSSFELLLMASGARDSLAFRRVFFHGKELPCHGM
jgi:hypothetical protein